MPVTELYMSLCCTIFGSGIATNNNANLAVVQTKEPREVEPLSLPLALSQQHFDNVDMALVFKNSLNVLS
jgi:hypothetical protein